MTDAYSVQQILGNRIAQTPPFRDYSQRVATTAFAARYWIDVRDFGAIGNGIVDDTAAIQAAINAVTNPGTYVYLPASSYQITSPLVVGNGSTAGQSTVAGIYLIGGGSTQTGGTTIFWNGAVTSAAMIAFLGPMKGWGLKNVILNGASLAGTGVKLLAASNGELDHVAFVNYTGPNILLNSLTTAATGNANCQFNTFDDYQIFLANVANTSAIFLDGNGVNANTNSSFNEFRNGQIIFPTASTAMFGIYMRDTDSNVFVNTSLFGGGSGTTALTFDYTGASSGIWPANQTFIGFDPDGFTASATKYANSGSPASGARPHRFYGLDDTNSATYPKIANTTYTPEYVNPGVSLTAQTASITSTNINTAVYVTGMYRFSVYLEVTTADAGSGATVSATLGWIDDSGASRTKSTASLAVNTLTNTYDVIDVAVRITLNNIPVFLTTVTGSIGAAQYALFIKMEKMD